MGSEEGAVSKEGSGLRRWLVAVLFVLALLLRLYGIFGRGVLLWDEGSYLMEGRFIASGVKAATWQLAGRLLPWVAEPTAEDLRDLVAGIAPGIMGKPGHAGLIALFMLIFGDTPFAGALLSIACSLVVMYLVYRLALSYGGVAAALTAAYVLALSPYMLFYSRVGLAEMDFALGGLVLLSMLWRRLQTEEALTPRAVLGLGSVAGLAFLVNYRGYILFALVVFWLGVLLIRQRASALRVLADMALVGAGFVLPLVLMEGLYRLGAGVAHTVRPGMELRTYFQQLQWLATAHGGEPLTPANVATYPYLFAAWEWPGLLLLVAGTVVAARRKRMEDFLVLSFFYLPMLQWSLRADGYARLAVLNLPAYGLLVGLGAAAMYNANRRRTAARAAVVGLLALFAVWGLWRDVPIMRARSLHERALTLTVQDGSRQVIDTNPGVAVVYEDLYGLHDVIRLPELPQDALSALRSTEQLGGKYVVTEMQKFVSGTQLMSLPRYQRSACHAIEANCQPIWQAPHMQGLFSSYCFEHNWGFAQTLELYRTYRDSAEMLRIYRIQDAIAALQHTVEEGN